MPPPLSINYTILPAHIQTNIADTGKRFSINSEQMLLDDLSYAENYKPMTLEDEADLFKTAVELGDYDRQMARGDVQDTADYALMERLRFWFGNQDIGRKRYEMLAIKGDACDECGACIPQCPYHIDIPYKLHLSDYKLSGKDLY